MLNKGKTKPKIVWVVTRYKGKQSDSEEPNYDIQGVFSSKKKACAACRDPMYGYGPMVLNESLPHETVEWGGYIYPFATGEKKE